MTALAKERVLVVDDEPQVLIALEDLLSDSFTVVKSTSAHDALEIMDRDHSVAVVITDQRMPKMSGAELLARLGPSSGATRILLTGYADLSAIVRAVNDGKIFAYVTKPWDAEDLKLKVQTAAERFRLSQELHNERRLLNSTLESMDDGVITVGRNREVLLFNRGARQILGVGAPATLPRDWLAAFGVLQTDRVSQIAEDQDPLLRAVEGLAAPALEVFVGGATQTGRIVTLTASALRNAEGQVWGGIALLRDVTEERNLAHQLAHAQKMDAIGRLAGGIAHDFNNVLAVILGYAELVAGDFPKGSSVSDDMSELINAVERAGGLTRQLLAFSRRQVIQAKLLQLNDIVANVEKMLLRVIGEDISLITKLSPTLGTIRGDPSQVEQIILNLTVNARDAMPTGGRLTVETANLSLRDADAASLAGVTPGDYVLLSVTDTGIGMDAETRRRIFEPFFTTKAVGKGTGLGLSTVYGIVNHGGGHIRVYSEPSRGTSFKIYFPRTDEVVTLAPPRSGAVVDGPVTGTILLVEDDEALRRVAVRILSARGYTVLEARGPAEALAICSEANVAVDLLLTDVVMPEMSGPKLADELTRRLPGLRVLFMSGYPAMADRNPLDEGTVVHIEKPFSPTTLVESVHAALGTAG